MTRLRLTSWGKWVTFLFLQVNNCYGFIINTSGVDTYVLRLRDSRCLKVIKTC